MTFNHKLVDEFLKIIFPLPEHFGIVDDGDDCPINYYELKQAIHKIDRKAQLYFGMSKMVITSPKLNNIVIKIPFNGYFSTGEEEKELIWTPFFWASGSNNSDYCLTEYEKFIQLKKLNLDCFVAKIFLYKIIDGINVFIQERVISEEDSYEKHSVSDKSQKLANKLKKEGGFNISSEWIANCIDKYKEFKVKKFFTYCTDIDLDILEDMHGGNYGYRLNGTPCLLDYSNFME